MATIIRGRTFAENEALTAEKLNDLVDSAQLLDIGQADLDTSLDFINPSQGGSPSANDNGIDGDGHLSFYDGSRWRKTSGAAYLTNNTGAVIPAFSPVVVDPSNALSIMMTDVGDGFGDTRVIGVTVRAIPDGNTDLVVTKGLAQVRVEPNASTTFAPGTGYVVAGNSQGSINPNAAVIVARSQITENALPYQAAAFGIVLEQVDADATLTEVIKWCLIFK